MFLKISIKIMFTCDIVIIFVVRFLFTVTSGYPDCSVQLFIIFSKLSGNDDTDANILNKSFGVATCL